MPGAIFKQVACNLVQLVYRIEMLELASYYFHNGTYMEGIRSFYTVLSDIEQGTVYLGDQRELDCADSQILQNPKKKKQDKWDKPTTKTASTKLFSCADFNLGKCTKADPHEG